MPKSESSSDLDRSRLGGHVRIDAESLRRMPYLPPARGRARKACRRISRSTRCRPHSTPSASRSRQTRRALGRVRRSVISHYHLLLSRSLQQWSLRCIASLRLTAAWYESGSRGTSGDTSSRIGTSHAGATGVAGRRLPDIRNLGPVENQDSTRGLVVIQALDGTIRTDRRPMGEDGAALSG